MGPRDSVAASGGVEGVLDGRAPRERVSPGSFTCKDAGHRTLYLDFETYSEAKLKETGAYRYMRDPSTQVILIAFAVDDGPVQVVDDVFALVNAEFRQELNRCDRIVAFNAQFERLVLQHLLHADLPQDLFHCAMVRSWQFGFSGSLEDVGKQMHLPTALSKMEEGWRLVYKFCQPAPRNHKLRRYDKHTSPEEWEEFREYARLDIEATRAIWLRLQGYPHNVAERQLWLVDQQINDRGLPIDTALVDAAQDLSERETRLLRERLYAMTGVNPGSVPKMLSYLREHGLPTLPDLQKNTLLSLDLSQCPAQTRHVVPLLQQLKKTSTAKWRSFQAATGEDARLRGVFQFQGAQRTGRWAGRLVQPQNLPSPSIPRIDLAADDILSGDRQFIELFWGPPMEVLSSCVRTAITAPGGKALVVCDLSSIESRVLGWLADCPAILKGFESNRDTYKVFASRLFKVPYDEVTKEQRKWAKPPALGCGFMLGSAGLVRYAAQFGVDMTERDAKTAVDLFRAMYPEVKNFWYALQDTILSTVRREAPRYVWPRLDFGRDGSFLWVTLPSGRRLWYPGPIVTPERNFGYLGMNQYTHKWERVTSHPGKLTENLVQAVARDVLAEGLTRAEEDPMLEVVGHVHDEIICLVDEKEAETCLERLREHMRTVPAWAKGLPLDAGGYVSIRYRKD